MLRGGRCSGDPIEYIDDQFASDFERIWEVCSHDNRTPNNSRLLSYHQGTNASKYHESQTLSPTAHRNYLPAVLGIVNRCDNLIRLLCDVHYNEVKAKRSRRLSVNTSTQKSR